MWNCSVGTSRSAVDYGYANSNMGIPADPNMLMPGDLGMMMPSDPNMMMSGDPNMVLPMGVDPYVDQYHHDMYMNSYANAEFIPVKTVLVDRADRGGVSAVYFDTQQELLWMGNACGHVTSYYRLPMQKYTSFQVHATDEIRHLLTWGHNIYSLTADTLHCTTKFGIPQYHHRSPSLGNMQCMLMTSPNVTLIGGHQSILVEMNLETRQETRQVEVSEAGCAIMRGATSLICCGDTSGRLSLLDPNTLRVVHGLQAHTGCLSDFDVCGNQLITCGFSDRNGTLTMDRLLMVFDMRFLKKMTPIQLTIDPMFLRFIPTFSNRICVVSQTGIFQVLEQGVLGQAPVYQLPTVEGAMVTSFDLSPSNQVLAFGDSLGYLHTFSSNIENPVLHQYPESTEFAAPLELPMHSISFDDEYTPYSIIPTPYPPPNERMLSEWPDRMCQFVYRQPAGLNMEIQQALKPRDNSAVLYAPRPSSRRPNEVPYVLNNANSSKKSNTPTSPMERGDPSATVVDKQYRKVEIKYSKLGVEDFDFQFYNRTNFAGLETHIPNAYCNTMLQVLYFIEPLRCALLSHLCEREFCLACELGFLIHMLDQQKGKTCQASNFLRAFRTIPEAAALGLILSDTDEAQGRSNLTRLIQNWNRFILQQLDSELSDQVPTKLLGNWKLTGGGPPPNGAAAEASGTPDANVASSTPPATAKTDAAEKDTDSSAATVTKPKEQSIVKSLFSYAMSNVFTCTKCSNTISRSTSSYVTDLSYPEISPEKTVDKVPFSSVIERSMCMDVITHTWCPKCNGYQPHTQTKAIESLPDVLSLNCHLDNNKSIDFWRKQEEIVKREREAANPTAPSGMGAQASFSQRSSRPVRPCRYGQQCTRSDCRFSHDNSEPEQKQSTHKTFHTLAFDEEIGPFWVPLGLVMKLTPDGRVEATDVHEEEFPVAKSPNDVYYELLASVVYISDAATGGNLVGHILVGDRYHKRKEGITHKTWYLFNDFAITSTVKNVAVNFEATWKLPCILYFSRVDINSRYDLTVSNPITSEALFINSSLVTPRRKTINFVPLDVNELPQRGDSVGLDAEFVTLNAEEAELRSDGTRSTIKPSQFAVARVSLIREKGPLKYVPFVDDYISTQEQVVDYLTQFSGIQPGDLDASLSSKHLTTLKSTYLKLRYLVSCGVVFVGHGLKKDFRVLNLVVPHDQVVDTVELFRLPRQRMISLKFLAWYFLGKVIQSGVHDSTEDAVTALRLYYKYKELCDSGAKHLNEEMDRLYEEGRSRGWQVPVDDFLESDT